jgi:hypothetical protein
MLFDAAWTCNRVLLKVKLMKYLCPFLLALLAASTATTVQADLLIYRLPGTRVGMILQGEITVNPGRTVTLSHPNFGQFHFGLDEVIFHEVPTTNSIFSKMLKRAVVKRDPKGVMVAAQWALRNGLVSRVYEAADAALELDPQNSAALYVRSLKSQMEQPLPESAEAERYLRDLVGRTDMKIKTSKHFILLHDTDDTAKGSQKSRADQRLKLLEAVYESFLLRFYAQGVELQIPTERLKVVLFRDQKDYLQFASTMSSELASTAGFYNMKKNVAVFFDQTTGEHFKNLRELADDLQKMKKEALKHRSFATKDIVRFAQSFQLLANVVQEQEDISTVSHECTHQMAANTGLLPRDVQIPVWVHEGLASYFETPNDTTWGGVGAVNADRLEWYRELEPDRKYSNLDFIVGDQIFSYALSIDAKLHGYGQAWALTHFLIERHFDQLMTFYRRLGDMPPDLVFSPEVLKLVFDEAFGPDRNALDAEWRAYMRSLKTNVEEILTD